ncbi:MAG: hypothetical protein AAB916_00150 [Patescibacteria group bacterium]
MAEPQITPLLFEIRPTAAQATEQYADIALTGLFNAHTAIINSERQAIWQRYNVMLIGNAIVLGFIAGGTRTKEEILAGAFFGFVLCTAWLAITASGWGLLAMRIERALQFQWPGFDPSINPFGVSIVYGRGSIGGTIYHMAITVIALFMIGYLYLGVGHYITP